MASGKRVWSDYADDGDGDGCGGGGGVVVIVVVVVVVVVGVMRKGPQHPSSSLFSIICHHCHLLSSFCHHSSSNQPFFYSLVH